jgi:hypothetical protein
MLILIINDDYLQTKIMLFETIERHGADLPASADFHQLSEPLDVDKAVYH